MQKIVTHLWYDKEAGDAALLYTGLLGGSGINSRHVMENTPSGNAEIVRFMLAGQQFSAISAGPYFKFNPSVSLMVACDTAMEVDALWKALIDGGTALMALGAYPFSGRYGWVLDRYGLSWQLMLTEPGTRQKITPNLLFSGTSTGMAEDAVRFYAEVFPDSVVGHISRYGAGEAASKKARVNYAAVTLSGCMFSAMDNAADVDYGFNEAISFMVSCRDQREIDYYWDKLSAVPEAEQCGWVKDKFGVSWQIVPESLDTFMFGGTPAQNAQAAQALLKMKKLDIAVLENARL